MESGYMEMTISCARRMLNYDKQEGRSQKFLYAQIGRKKIYISCDKAYRYLKELEKKGYRTIPDCNNVDDKGACKGHRERKNKRTLNPKVGIIQVDWIETFKRSMPRKT